MNYSNSVLSAFSLGLILFMACGNPKPVEEQQSETAVVEPVDEEASLRAANDSFYAALNAMFVGDMEGMNAIWSNKDYVTQMGPFGGRLTGWEHVGADFQKNADMKFGGKIVCKDLHMHMNNGIGYTSCIEEGENLDSNGVLMKVRHRATNIFELQDGAWKMVHHHTDLSPQLEASYDEAVNEEVE